MPKAPAGTYIKVGPREGKVYRRYVGGYKIGFGISLRTRWGRPLSRTNIMVQTASDRAIFEHASDLIDTYNRKTERETTQAARMKAARMKAVSGKYPPKTRIGGN